MRKFIYFLGVFLLSGAGLVGIAMASPSATAGGVNVVIRANPEVIGIGKATLYLYVTTSQGKPLIGAHVTAFTRMPGMNMGEHENNASEMPGHTGIYSVPAAFAMEGTYSTKVTVASSAVKPVSLELPIATGETVGGMTEDKTDQLSAQPATVSGTRIWFIGAVIVGLVVLVLAVRSAKRMDKRKLFSAVISIVLLVAAIGAANYAVTHFRRQGAMTPLEAQGMQMEMPAPEGTAPVESVEVRESIQASGITLTGTVEGLNEQDISARVQGAILSIIPYVGDKVTPGELLVKLDTSVSAPQTDAQAAGVRMATQGVNVATREYEQTMASIKEAHAEVGMKQGAVEGAQAGRTSAAEERNAAVADLAAAKTMRQDADAGLEAARADNMYWRSEIARERSLYARGAITQEELQREESQARAADARQKQAESRTMQVAAQIRSAEANVKKSDASVEAAKARLKEAQSELDSHFAHVVSSQAIADSAKQKILQARAGEEQAKAMLMQATHQQAFSEIRALTAGVVTRRIASPGTTVGAGQPILQISDVSSLRIKAYPAEQDLRLIHTGTPVKIQFGSGETINTRISSAGGQVDPVSRTGAVEVIIPNPDRKIRPGESVKVSISLTDARPGVWVPSRAIQTRTSPSSDSRTDIRVATVWILSGSPDNVTAHQVEVTTGETNGELTAIKGGLHSGDRVIVSGEDYLHEGERVQERQAAR